MKIGRMRALSARATAMALGLVACGGGAGTSADAGLPQTAALSATAALGDKIFCDLMLSASGQQSCASYHSAANAHGPANSLAVQPGGSQLELSGRRNTPSINYASFTPAFSLAADGTPSDGQFLDGRADSLQAQAAQPFTNPTVMANAGPAEVMAKLARAPYAEAFKKVFGVDILSRPEAAFEHITLALQQFQCEDTGFRPFTSKYDEFLRGNLSLSAQELRGLAGFNAPNKGNCAACHPSARAADGSLPLFTDFSYDNLGVPRNSAITRNADLRYFDLGLCDRPELIGRSALCGTFKVPTLRNVALRRALFHDGRFATLKEALTFYVQRDTQPEKFYPLAADGSVRQFDDLPRAYRANVNTSDAPDNRQPGDTPALSDAEIDDVIAFLATLTDSLRR